MESIGSSGEWSVYKSSQAGYQCPEFAKPRNSILNRPIRQMSMKNMESADIQEQRDHYSFNRTANKYNIHAQSHASSFRNAWSEIPDQPKTTISNPHLKNSTRVTPNGLKNTYNDYIDSPGKRATVNSNAFVGSAGYNIINCVGSESVKSAPAMPGWGEGKGKGKVFNEKSGMYNPLIHQWTVAPVDARYIDRENKPGKKAWR